MTSPNDQGGGIWADLVKTDLCEEIGFRLAAAIDSRNMLHRDADFEGLDAISLYAAVLFTSYEKHSNEKK